MEGASRFKFSRFPDSNRGDPFANRNRILANVPMIICTLRSPAGYLAVNLPSKHLICTFSSFSHRKKSSHSSSLLLPPTSTGLFQLIHYRLLKLFVTSQSDTPGPTCIFSISPNVASLWLSSRLRYSPYSKPRSFFLLVASQGLFYVVRLSQ